jgi:hypothetical protein
MGKIQGQPTKNWLAFTAGFVDFESLCKATSRKCRKVRKKENLRLNLTPGRRSAQVVSYGMCHDGI